MTGEGGGLVLSSECLSGMHLEQDQAAGNEPMFAHNCKVGLEEGRSKAP